MQHEQKALQFCSCSRFDKKGRLAILYLLVAFKATRPVSSRPHIVASQPILFCRLQGGRYVRPAAHTAANQGGNAAHEVLTSSTRPNGDEVCQPIARCEGKSAAWLTYWTPGPPAQHRILRAARTADPAVVVCAPTLLHSGAAVPSTRRQANASPRSHRIAG